MDSGLRCLSPHLGWETSSSRLWHIFPSSLLLSLHQQHQEQNQSPTTSASSGKGIFTAKRHTSTEAGAAPCTHNFSHRLATLTGISTPNTCRGLASYKGVWPFMLKKHQGPHGGCERGRREQSQSLTQGPGVHPPAEPRRCRAPRCARPRDSRGQGTSPRSHPTPRTAPRHRVPRALPPGTSSSVQIRKEQADTHFCIENIYFTTVVSDNLAIFILVYIQTYNTQITMLKHKIIPSAVTACMYRSSVVSSVTIHKVQTATSTYIQFKVWSFSNITKYIYVYIIIASQMHLYFHCGWVGFGLVYFLFCFLFYIFFFLFLKTGSPHPPSPS